jgi:Fe-S cluster biogenesis protein NfuA
MARSKEELIEIVNQSIEQLRPFLLADGGDIELLDITSEGVAQVKLLGACSSCSMSLMTLKAGLEESLKTTAPEIVSVVSIDEKEELLN